MSVGDGIAVAAKVTGVCFMAWLVGSEAVIDLVKVVFGVCFFFFFAKMMGL